MRGLRGSVVTAFFVTLSLALAGSAAALSVGARAPEIGRPDLNGRTIQMSGLRGKVVIVDFWASWCEPCREEMPVLDRLYRDLRERGLVVVGVSVDRTIGNVNGFLRRTPVSFPIVHDANHEIANRYAPPRMPSSYIIDRRGVVRHVHEGFRSGDAATIRREVQALLGD
jgi:peroxiredoxin